jgi:hypothetical protein
VAGTGLALVSPSIATAAPPTITGTNIVATAGTQFSGVIATSNLSPGEASINWGDSTTTSGTIAADGTITGTHTYAQEGDFAIVITQGVTTGNSTAIVLSASQGSAVVGTNVTTVAAGSSGTASVLPPGGAGVTATLQQPNASATLFVAVYANNPQPVPLAVGSFYDVRVVGGAGATLQVVFHYTGVAGPAQLLFFDAETGRYEPVQSSSISIDPVAHTVTVVFNSGTVPSVTQLTMTVFAISAAPVTATFTG